MDRLEAMQAFVAVAELRGFAKAATRLHLSKPAVTRLVAALEEHLSTRLLNRTTRSVSLTDAGARFLDRARRILQEVDTLEQTARAERAKPAGRFVLTAPLTFGRLRVAPLLLDFLSQYPEVEGELVLADRFVHLVDEGVDLAVRIGHLDDSSLRARPVGATRRVVVASPRYLKKAPKLREPKDVAKHRVVQLTPLSAAPEWRFAKGEEDLRVAFTPSFRTNSVDAALDWAERGEGLSLALAYQVADSVREGRLRVVLASFETTPLPIQLVYPSSRLVSATVRAFIEFVVSKTEWSF